jgi:hypothetical protein
MVVAMSNSCRAPINESVVLRDIIRSLELSGHHTISIDDLSHTFVIKRRGLYEFVSICSVFGICRRYANSGIEWFGLCRAATALATIRAQTQAEPDSQSLFPLFDYSTDSSLPRLSEAVVRLFFCVGTQSLDLRKVAKLFSQGKTKYKTMLRKLYTVVMGLELAGIISRTTVVSEIRLNAAVPPAEPQGSQFALASILNSKREVDTTIGTEKRRREYDQLTVESVYEADPINAALDRLRSQAPPPGLLRLT